MNIVVTRHLKACRIARTAIEDEAWHTRLDCPTHQILIHPNHEQVVPGADRCGEFVEPLRARVYVDMVGECAPSEVHFRTGVTWARIEQAIQVRVIQGIFIHQGKRSDEVRQAGGGSYETSPDAT